MKKLLFLVLFGGLILTGCEESCVFIEKNNQDFTDYNLMKKNHILAVGSYATTSSYIDCDLINKNSQYYENCKNIYPDIF
jgi:hypothetical protein